MQIQADFPAKKLRKYGRLKYACANFFKKYNAKNDLRLKEQATQTSFIADLAVYFVEVRYFKNTTHAQKGRRNFLSVIFDTGSKSTLVVASPRERCFIKDIQNQLTWLFTERDELGSN